MKDYSSGSSQELPGEHEESLIGDVGVLSIPDEESATRAISKVPNF